MDFNESDFRFKKEVQPHAFFSGFSLSQGALRAASRAVLVS